MTRLLIFLLTILFPFSISSVTVVGIIGDSISIPYPIMPAEGYHAILAKEFDWRIVNYSIGGSSTKSLMSRLQRMIQSDKPQILIIALGINDALTGVSLNDTFKNLCQAIEYATAENILILVGITDLSSVKWAERNYRSQFKNVYYWAKIKHPQIELFDFLTQEIISNPLYLYGGNGCHPNTQGHEKIADNMRQLLKRLGSLESAYDLTFQSSRLFPFRHPPFFV